MKKRSLFLLLAGMLTLASCGKNDNSTSDHGKVSSVSISQPSIEVQIGKRSTDVAVSLEGEGDYNKNVKLVSENEAIAKASFTEVESGGTFKVYGIAVGETKINVVSMQDETKAASLSVQVKAKEEAPGVSEIVSVSLSKETHLFHASDEPLEVTASLVGRGTFDDTMVITMGENPAVSLDKSELKDGEKFVVTPKSLSQGVNTTIHVASKQDVTKYSELIVRVDEDLEPETPETELKLKNYAHNFILKAGEEQETFEVVAETSAGTVTWSWKDADANEYVTFVETPTGNSAKVKPLKVTEEGRKITLVAKIGDLKKECKFTVTEQPSEFRTYYLSNNGYLNYEEVWFYTYAENGGENAPFPGVKLDESIKNTLGEDCFIFYVDVAKYDACIFSDGNGNQTADVYYSSFTSNNNIWFDGEGNANFTMIAKDEPNISFYSNSVSLYLGEEASTFGFDVRKGDAKYQVTSGQDKIEVTNFSNGSISVKGLKLGNAAVRVYIEDEEGGVLAEDYLYVEVLDISSVTSFYFSNNKGWDKVFVYAWQGDNESANEEYAPWPGIELVNPLKNKEGEDVYKVHVPAKYNMVIVNGSKGEGHEQTENIDISAVDLTVNNNMYPNSGESPYSVSYAVFSEFEYSVKFESNTATVYEGRDTRVRVKADGGSGVIYNVIEGSDCVSIIQSYDDHIVIKWLKEGTAKIKASLHESSDELVVTASGEVAPTTHRTVYFTNVYGWSKVYLYAWGPATSTSWPGIEITEHLYNTSLQDVFVLDIDDAKYDKIIVNDGGNGAQTVDLSIDLVEFATNNNIYPTDTDDAGHYYCGFATFDPLDPQYKVVDITFTCTKDTGYGGTLYLVFFDEYDNAEWVALSWSEGNVWRFSRRYIAGTSLSFKACISYGQDDNVWEKEGTDNRHWDVPDTSTTYDVVWGQY